MAQIKKQNLAFVDIETTGLDADMHEIISIGCVLVAQDWSGETPSFEVLDKFELKVKPEHIETADKTSLKICGYDEADWVFAYSLPEALKIFAKKTEDAIMVGHNLFFDDKFIDRSFKKTGIENKMHYHKLDTISIAFAKLHGREDIDKFSLRQLCMHFKIENRAAHTALADAEATFELYKKLLAL